MASCISQKTCIWNLSGLSWQRQPLERAKSMTGWNDKRLVDSSRRLKIQKNYIPATSAPVQTKGLEQCKANGMKLTQRIKGTAPSPRGIQNYKMCFQLFSSHLRSKQKSRVAAAFRGVRAEAFDLLCALPERRYLNDFRF